MFDSVFSKIIRTRSSIIQTVNGDVETIEHGLNPKSLSEFFTTNDRILEIPSYQRPYTWEKDNIIDLISDINNIKDNQSSSWFLGSIFITSDNPKSNKIQLLDGQQRITTIQILIWQLFFVQRHISNILTPAIREEISINDIDLLTEFNRLRGRFEGILKSNKREAGQTIPRFLLRSENSEIWKKFIQQIDIVENKNEAKTYIEKTFFKELDENYKKGFPSAANIKSAFGIIEKKLDDEFYNHIADSYKSDSLSIQTLMSNLVLFSLSLLDKFWLIEIELNHANDSLKIFEGINNRGKGLSLTDKLRFKCLINLKDEENKNKVKELWRQAYSLIQYNKEKGLVKGEDDFFTYLLISITKKDLPDENSKVKFFEEEIIYPNQSSESDEESIVNFCNKMILILSHMKSLNEFNDHNFQIKIFSTLAFQQAQALYALFRKVIHYSDNSRFLYFNLLYNSKIEKPQETDILVLLGMMNIIKTVLHIEVFKNLQSNAVRTLYIGIVKRVNNSDEGSNDSNLIHTLYKNIKENYSNYQFDKDEFQINGSDVINNYIAGNDSNKDILILYFYNYHVRHDDLRNQIQSYKKQETHLEHILPQNWITNWGNTEEFTIDDVVSEINNFAINFPFLQNCINPLYSKGDRIKFVHDDSKKSQKHPKESLGQWIGNKLVTHQKVNLSVSNLNWSQKKIKLQMTSFIKIPSENLSKVGINEFENFDYKAIIERSMFITQFILDNLNSNNYGWEPVKSNW
jgi:uncharacterized protein with ParB-like and HNH nuclease domain